VKKRKKKIKIVLHDLEKIWIPLRNHRPWPQGEGEGEDLKERQQLLWGVSGTHLEELYKSSA